MTAIPSSCFIVAGIALLSSASFAAPAVPPLEGEAREILDQLLAVDTTGGNETAALRPVAERFRKVGVSVELLESAPGRGNLIARIPGSGKKRPLLLLAHIDVVPTTGQPWTTAPFVPTEKDGYLYARGVGDDKSMAAAIVAVALELARSHARLARDVIVALTAGEETGGDAGVRWLVAHHKKLIDAELALNETGMLTLSDDGTKMQLVGIQTAEKSYQTYSMTARDRGGHSSVPRAETDPVTRLARALVRLGEFRFPARVDPAARELLALRASTEKAPLADALRRATGVSAPRLTAADDQLLSTVPDINAQIRTTCVATMLQASPQDNVLPTSVVATVNCRILPGETREATEKTLARVVADPAIEVKPIEDIGVGPASPLGGPVDEAVRRVAAKLWPGAALLHNMSTGATDSRHLRNAGIASYGIACAPSTLADARNAHGPDERRPLRWLGDGVRYLREVTLELAR